MKILVIGGAGFFGSKIIDGLLRLPKVDIVIGGRSKRESTLEINLENMSDFSKLTAFDFVINTSAIPAQNYAALVTYCLANPVRFIETTAVFHTVERLLAIKADMNKTNDNESTGLFLFGAGVFPGISNLVYKKHLEIYRANKSIALNVRYKVLSGAGRGMCRLMAESLDTPCAWFQNSAIVRSKAPFNSMVKMPTGSGKSYSIQLALPEILFINAHTQIPNIKAFISFKPTFISVLSYWSFNRIPHLGIFKKAALNFLYPFFYLVRGRILKKKNTDISITCITDDNDVSGIWFNNAFLAAGLFIAAIIAFYQNSNENKGIVCAEQVFNLDDVVGKMMELGGGDLEYRCF